MVNKRSLQRIREQGNMILKSRFFKNFTTLERYEFLQFCHRRKYKEGEYIYYQNDPGTGMYFIESGRVQLKAVNNLEESNRGNITFDLDAPESFGVLSIGYDLNRMSSAKCMTDCVLLGFFNPDFETLKKRHPQMAVKFLENVSTLAMKQLKETTLKLVEATDAQTAFSLHFRTYYEKE